ncbi:MAG: HEAT repeat domain-containing protein [Pyrinomonadaceae bacterium]|nr:HEAT repeat domain-containing protein [Pyrinomonadaceae bacterium]
MGTDAPRDTARFMKQTAFNNQLRIASFLFMLFACFAVTTSGQDIEKLAELVRTGSTEQKRDSLFDLRNLRTAAASRAAVPALSDADAIVRATAASSIVFLPETELAVYLRPLLSDKDAFVRREAAYSLRNDRTGIATSALIKLLLEDSVMEVRTAAAVALGSGDSSAVEALTRILAKKPKDDNEFLRRSAARSIGQIAETVRGGRRQNVTPQDFLPEKFKYTALADMPAASAPQFRQAVTVLLKVAANSKETDDTRREAAFALGGIGDRSAVAFLTANLTNKDTYLAEICREALLKLPKPE